ncbi:phosphotransferase system HPr (HPr) family [Halobacillus karajensis]|uniref:Phosphocarrier protein HPr n=1 Tax=Halobacillus karajensis TaxID=195088 RepID=A0A059NZ41_9BACI|nr:HPr family phosphocarrier protein [Halobacillus karajensis]CDQ18894.1 phosphocarrier protein HPr [Halobacillus karajensis]CDQ23033.1 phosphocarrier protein HPr [Halobacillus karajensis]CDQ26515.1 phosphocarrier protein HPr [Halobacillus karajensis]SEH44682.1 phosphotransferase system HPr (HPr) family [Halobacillus karajensis]
MSGQVSKNVKVHMKETQTIMELSQIIQRYDSEIILKKVVQGNIHEANLKSFLGLINLRLQEGDEIEVTCIGTDAAQALKEVETFLQP